VIFGAKQRAQRQQRGNKWPEAIRASHLSLTGFDFFVLLPEISFQDIIRTAMEYPLLVETLIPHRDRMKLIDEIVDITSEKAVTQTEVSEKWPLFRQGSVDSLVIIEIVAQTAAVLFSWKTSARENSSSSVSGLLAGIKNADFFAGRIPVNTLLTTTVKPLYSADNYTVLEGTVQTKARTLGNVKIGVLRVDQ